ncbi:MAG: response regulator transcription factor [Alphaproteobacteria bacterium]|nr:response regulator transcription factor [Alphaproteobacteria bacterium]
MRILLVEHNIRLAEMVVINLQKAGFVVDSFATGAEGLAAVDTTRYDAVALDLGLPDMDGFDVLRLLRGQGNIAPVLILTTRDSVHDRVKGLNGGADDTLLKPFAMEELVARLRALLRRPGGVLGVTLSVGNLTLDTVAREVRVDGTLVRLSRRETEVLEHLMRRAGRVVPKSVIEESLYGFAEEVTANSVEAQVSRLRKRLLAINANLSIHTRRGIGYLLMEGRKDEGSGRR